MLFIPTAANDNETRSVVSLCLQEIIDLGIPYKNIEYYGLEYHMILDELEIYDVIYFCGGSETYLMNKINEVKFGGVLKKAINNGLFYIGVSAGSMIASASVENSLKIIPNKLESHCTKNITPCGSIPSAETEIGLSDNTAVWIYGDNAQIIE